MSFASRIKQLASETAIYGLSSILGRIVGYLLVPFYTWFFAPDEYGVVIAVYAAFVFLNVVYTYGMESAYLKYASGSEGRARVVRTFSTATLTLLASSSLLSLLLLIFRQPVGVVISLDASWFFLINYAAVILVLDTLAVVPMAELRLQNRPWRFAATRLAGIGANVVLNVLFIAMMRLGIEAILIANVVSSALVLLLLLPLYYAHLEFNFDRTLWRELMRFGLPFLPSGLGYALTETVSRFFLGHMSRERVIELYGDRLDLQTLAEKAERAALAVQEASARAGTLNDPETHERMASAAEGIYGAHVLGVFGTCYKLALFMMLVVQMFRYAWQPFFLQYAEDPDARPLFSRVFTLFTAGGLVVFLAVSFFVEELVAIPLPGVGPLIEPSFWLGLHIVPVVLLAYLFQGWYYNFSAGLYIQEKTKYFVHNTLLGALVTIVLNVLFVRHYGMIAAAWATLAAYATMALALLAASQRFYRISYDWTRIGAMGVIAGAVFFLWHEVPMLQVWFMEVILLLSFIASLFLLRVVTPGSVRTVMRSAS